MNRESRGVVVFTGAKSKKAPPPAKRGEEPDAEMVAYEISLQRLVVSAAICRRFGPDGKPINPRPPDKKSGK